MIRTESEEQFLCSVLGSVDTDAKYKQWVQVRHDLHRYFYGINYLRITGGDALDVFTIGNDYERDSKSGLETLALVDERLALAIFASTFVGVAYMYVDREEKIEIMKSLMPSKLANMCNETVNAVDGLKLDILDGVAAVDLDGFLRQSASKWNDKNMPHSVSISGLNGSGKSMGISALRTEFPKSPVVHFPRYNGKFGEMNKKSLVDNDFDPVSRQLLYYADIADHVRGMDLGLEIWDRNPFIDGMVYSELPQVRIAGLALQSSLRVANLPIWLDRHPFGCFKQVANRGEKPRVFEDHYPKMVKQAVRGWMLPKLGATIVNVDFTPDDELKSWLVSRISPSRIQGYLEMINEN